MRRRLVILVALAALLAGACSDDPYEPLPPPPSVPPEPTTTAPPDLTGVALPEVAGRTTTTVPAVVGGRASVVGLVRGPGGAVPGAVVQAERVVGDAIGRVQVTSGPDGRFFMPNIFGGRYRVRAWKPAPDNLAMTKPLVFFLNGSETKQLDLPLEQFEGTAVAADVAPNPPFVRQRTAVVVQVTQRSVDAGGVVRALPVGGIGVELFGAGRWTVLTANPTVTDGGGRARFELRCEQAGNQPLSVLLSDSQAFPLDISACTTSAPPTTASTTTSTSTTMRSTSSTTSSTTSTTRPRGGGGGGR